MGGGRLGCSEDSSRWYGMGTTGVVRCSQGDFVFQGRASYDSRDASRGASSRANSYSRGDILRALGCFRVTVLVRGCVGGFICFLAGVARLFPFPGGEGVRTLSSTYVFLMGGFYCFDYYLQGLHRRLLCYISYYYSHYYQYYVGSCVLGISIRRVLGYGESALMYCAFYEGSQRSPVFTSFGMMLAYYSLLGAGLIE